MTDFNSDDYKRRRYWLPIHIRWLLVAALAGVGGFLARGVAESPPGSEILAPKNDPSTVPEFLGLLLAAPQSEFPARCPICGGLRDSYARLCKPDEVCFELVRCRKCGTLAFLQVDLSGQVLVGPKGVVGVVDANDTILRGDAAVKQLYEQGKMGAVLEMTSDGFPQVRALVAGGAAERAGLHVGDQILRVGETDCAERDACKEIGTLFSRQTAPSVPVRLKREGKSIDLTVRR